MSQPPASSPIFARSIPGSKLSDYIRRTVSVTGRVKQVEDGFVLLEACDGKEVRCRLATDSVPACRYLKVMGEVHEDLTLHQAPDQHVLVPLGDQLDMQLVNDVMYLTNHPRLSSLFQPPSSKRVR
ncbi:replication factor a protein 3 protein [Cystoisospora suis]|uniref:Replication factor a protein 3 protein n=1 Tax=Cystoisospora suis TaxID=483139 RepID=A0A2C6L4I7_9APIC|nr:replication factor a protein 3 protein [Cystoisospora suis]